MHKPKPRTFMAIMVLVSMVASCQAQSGKIDAKEQAQVVNKIAGLLKENYVFEDVGDKAGKFIREQQAKGTYAGMGTEEFGMQVTHDLQSVSHDLHMQVVAAPPNVSDQDSADEEAKENHALRHDAPNNFSFVKLERLPGNVGYIDLRGFAPASTGGATAVAAMNFLANCDVIIFDLRKNHGGEPTMIQLITSYFFDSPTHLNSLYWRKGPHTDHFSTNPYVPGAKNLSKVPLYVLTSKKTASAGEEFTNNLKVLKRAKIIGETTIGAANPGAFFGLNSQLAIFIPTGRAVNPVDGSNWEGKGVEPDEKVPAENALNVAYKEALEQIAAKTKDPQQKADVASALAQVDAKQSGNGLSGPASK